ncbi:MAG: N-acetyltransferase [uncultured Sulfurovum sp.]|uniref:N-acetyltransferase n=1 Tax=uncultured Sulfurovum sp. TaxID=269237 RepID=A0A6S6TEU2_9BACT|nr:MAG: N-acetyltransferase [uncultured Sulfurovum sp.]
MNNTELIHNQNENKYEFHIEGFKPYIQYEQQGNVLHLTHTIVPKELGGRGIAKNLCIAVMEDVEAKGLKMKPACSYIVAFIEKNPQYESLLGA